MRRFPVLEAFRYAGATMWANRRLYAGLCVLLLLVGVIDTEITKRLANDTEVALAVAASIVVGVYLWLVQMEAALRVHDGDPVTFSALFRLEGRHAWKAIWASFCYGIVVMLGFVALVVPGLFLAARYLPAPYLAFEHGFGAGEAMTQAKAMTVGVPKGMTFVLLTMLVLGAADWILPLPLNALVMPLASLAQVYVYRQLQAPQAA